MEKKSVDDVFDGGDRCGAFPLNTLRLRDLPKLVTVVHTSSNTRDVLVLRRDVLRPEGRIPSDCYSDCLRNTNPSYTWADRLTLSALIVPGAQRFRDVLPRRHGGRVAVTEQRAAACFE